MSRLIVRYNDFSKGDAGWVDKTKVQAGFFLGENVVPYRDGSLGPRSGVLDLAPASIPGGTVVDLGYVDMGLGGPEYVWLRSGSTLNRIPVYDAAGRVLTGQSWAATTGAFAGAHHGDYVDYNDHITLFTSSTDKCYKCDWAVGANGTLTAITGSPGGNCIEIFGDFLVVASLNGKANRIQFSAPSDYTSWPAGNFIDIDGVGSVALDQPAITAMRRVRDQLLIFFETGHLFVITGTLGSNEVIREYMHGDNVAGPFDNTAVVRSRDGSVWWARREEAPNLTDQPFDNPSALPVRYQGGIRDDTPAQGGYLRQNHFNSSRTTETCGVPGRQDKSVVIFDPLNRALMLRNDAWSRHNWAAHDHFRVAAGGRGDVFMMDVLHTVFRVWQFEMERPPFKFRASATEQIAYATDDFGSAYSPPAWFATPQYRTPDFGNVIVEAVEVLFTSHWTRDSLNNHIDCFIQQYEVPGAIEVIDTSKVPTDADDTAGAMTGAGVTIGCETQFDAAPPAAPFDNRRRVTFFPKAGSPRPAPAIRVMLKNLRGVSIHEILVFGEITPPTRP